MVQLSGRPLKTEIKEKIVGLLPLCITLCKNRQLAADFVNDLLTPTEIIMIGKRISIALMILKDFSPDEISQRLSVSLTTINNVKTWLDIKGEGYKKVLQEVIEIDEEQERVHEEVRHQAEETTPRYGISWNIAKSEEYKKLKNTPKPPF